MPSDSSTPDTSPRATERAVGERYSAAASEREPALCCPVEYDRRHLEVVPDEVIERDYGCGDPSAHVREGDTVLDLGSGGGKICFIASQLVGPKGTVIGVDINPEMLELARRSAPIVAEKVGYANVHFRRGRIQDLALDADQLERWLANRPVRTLEDLSLLEDEKDRLRRDEPMVPDATVDLVVSNCVLNLVHESDKAQLVREIFRVLKVGGRIAISDIVSDEEVPAELRSDPELWSGCISGAFHEKRLLDELAAAGFYGIAIDKWEDEPFAVVDGIEFRSITVTATKGKEGPCFEANQAVVYRGPWKRVQDDDGHVLERGERTAVCDKTHHILTSAPYASQVLGIEPRVPVPEADRAPFDCRRSAPRHPRETKGPSDRETRGDQGAGSCC